MQNLFDALLQAGDIVQLPVELQVFHGCQIVVQESIVGNYPYFFAQLIIIPVKLPVHVNLAASRLVQQRKKFKQSSLAGAIRA
jgi:hypothetical protein